MYSGSKSTLNLAYMKTLLPTIEKWTTAQQPFVIARVIKTWGSAPRPVGSAMLVSKDMEIAGSVSGGCVEGAVIKAAQQVMESGHSLRLAYGVTDEDAWSVGLSCGGKIQVFAEPFWAYESEEKAIWERMQHCFKHNEGCILVTKIQDGPGERLLVLPDGEVVGTIHPALVTAALRVYRERQNQTVEIAGTAYFIQVFPRKSQLLIIGAAHITVDLIDLAHKYDFETIVIDPRGFFVEKTQFVTVPDQLITKYPSEVLEDFKLDPYTYAVILSHDPKIDDNALHLLLKSSIGYIGALGSKRTHAKRVNRLQEAGFSELEIQRIHAPIGMDIKARSPKEIALSIMGELILAKNTVERAA